LEVCVAFSLRDSMLKVPKFVDSQVNLRLVEGVPGAGKTVSLIKNLEEDQGVLTASKVNQTELHEKVTRAVEERNLNLDPKVVKTFDSFVINPRVHKKGLVLDEAFLRHPGFWFVSLWMSDPRVLDRLKGSLIIYGDRVQIRWNARGLVSTIHDTLPEEAFDKVEFLDHSYRCPGDVMVRIKPMYGGKPVYTYSAVRRSVGILKIRSVDDVPILKGMVYVCFTQMERSVLRAACIRKGLSVNMNSVAYEKDFDVSIYTPETFQGQTRKQIMIVRSQLSSSIAYKPPEQRLVADSRHTHELVYACVSALEDMFLSQLETRVSDEQLGLVMRELPAGGYVHTPEVCKCGFNYVEHSLFVKTKAERVT